MRPRRLRCRPSFHQDAAGLARADQQIVGPAQIDAQPGDSANGFGGGESGGQRQQRQTSSGNPRAQQHADVKSLTGGGVPGMVAASAAGQLLVSKIYRPVRRTGARCSKRIRVGGIGYRRKMQIACEDGVCERGIRERRDRTLPASLRFNAHGNVGRLGGVSQRAHADEVHAGFGIGANVLKHDAAGSFSGNPATSLSWPGPCV